MAKEPVLTDDKKAEEVAHKETAEAELAADNKALAEAHLIVFENELASRTAARLRRALGRLTDQELEAEIGKRRK